MRASTGGLLGRTRLRQGRLEEAAAVLKQSLDLIEAKGFRGEWSSDPLNGFAELCLIDAGRLSGAARRQAMRRAARACDKALAAPGSALWLPETCRLQGDLAWLRRSGAARDDGRRGLVVATDLGLPVGGRASCWRWYRLGDVALVIERARSFERSALEWTWRSPFTPEQRWPPAQAPTSRRRSGASIRPLPRSTR
jgi:hypothetical protein